MPDIHPKHAAGIIYLKVDGEMIAAKGSFTHRTSALKKEYTCMANGAGYFTSKPEPGYIKGTLVDLNETDVEKIRDGEGVSVTLEQANGKVVSAKDAIQVDAMEVNDETGEVAAEWRSDTVEIVR